MASRSLLLWLVLTASLALASCKRTPADRPAPAASAAPASVSSAELLAFASVGTSSTVDALITASQARVRRQPEQVDPWLVLGRAWVRKARESSDPGFYLNASACADRALALVPADPGALGLRAQVKLNEHAFDAAFELASRIVSAKPDDLVALGVRADAALELGRYPEAEADVQRMIDLKPNLPSYTRVSYLRWLHGDVAGAKDAARQAIDAGRDSRDPEPGAWAIVQAAMIFWHEGDVEGADAGFDRALERFADFPPALVGKARVALAKSDAKKAVSLLEKADAASPLVETSWLLGDARTLAGDAPGAQKAYEAVVKRGRQTDAKTLALFYAIKNREPDEALRLARQELAARGELHIHDVAAWALYRASKLPEAKAESDRAMALGTPEAQLIYHAGAIAIALGDRVGGVKLVKRALELNPHFDVTGAAEARALLDDPVRR